MATEMTNVTSSNLQSVGYDPDTEVMTVQFRSGTEWEYEGVPQDVFEAVRDADSPGKQFIVSVRDSYNARRV